MSAPPRRWILTLLALPAALGCDAPARPRVGVSLGAEGIAMATFVAEEVNAAGGIGGRPLELVLEREASTTSARPALESASRLAADPSVVAVVGHANSGASLAAAQVYNERGVPQIAPTSTSPLLAGVGPWTFQLVGSDTHQGQFLADAIGACRATPRIALLYVNDDYGRGLELVVRRALVRAGVPIVYEAPVGDADDFAGEELARAIAAQRPDMVVWLARAPSLETLIAPLRAQLPAVDVLSSDGIESAPVVRGDSSFVGVRLVRFIPTMAESPPLATLEQRFRRRYPEMQLTGLGVLTYDAMMLVVEGLRAGADRRESLRAHLEGLGRGGAGAFRGLSGAIAFDSTGAAMPRYFLAEVTPTGLRPASRCAGGTP